MQQKQHFTLCYVACLHSTVNSPFGVMRTPSYTKWPFTRVITTTTSKLSKYTFTARRVETVFKQLPIDSLTHSVKITAYYSSRRFFAPQQGGRRPTDAYRQEQAPPPHEAGTRQFVVKLLRSVHSVTHHWLRCSDSPQTTR